MEVAQLRREVLTAGGVVELSTTTERCKSSVMPRRAALPRIAYGVSLLARKP